MLHELHHTPPMVLDKCCLWYSCGGALGSERLVLLPKVLLFVVFNLCVEKSEGLLQQNNGQWMKMGGKWTFLGSNTPGQLYATKEGAVASKQSVSLNAGSLCFGHLFYALVRRPACT